MPADGMKTSKVATVAAEESGDAGCRDEPAGEAEQGNSCRYRGCRKGGAEEQAAAAFRQEKLDDRLEVGKRCAHSAASRARFGIEDDRSVHAGGEAWIMGCDDKRAPLGKRKQAFGDLVCGLSVEVRCRLVRKHDAGFRVAGGAGDGEAQRFAAGHTYATIAKRTTSVAAGETAELCEFEGLCHGLRGNTRAAGAKYCRQRCPQICAASGRPRRFWPGGRGWRVVRRW